jgi:hypothetical protein
MERKTSGLKARRRSRDLPHKTYMK